MNSKRKAEQANITPLKPQNQRPKSTSSARRDIMDEMSEMAVENEESKDEESKIATVIQTLKRIDATTKENAKGIEKTQQRCQQIHEELVKQVDEHEKRLDKVEEDLETIKEIKTNEKEEEKRNIILAFKKMRECENTIFVKGASDQEEAKKALEFLSNGSTAAEAQLDAFEKKQEEEEIPGERAKKGKKQKEFLGLKAKVKETHYKKILENKNKLKKEAAFSHIFVDRFMAKQEQDILRNLRDEKREIEGKKNEVWEVEWKGETINLNKGRLLIDNLQLKFKPMKKKLILTLWNCTSLSKKILFTRALYENDLGDKETTQILGLCETWKNEEVNDIEMSKKLKLKVRQSNRNTRKGGSCLLGIARNETIDKEMKLNIEDTVQAIAFRSPSLNIVAATVYLPPDSSANISIQALEQIQEFFEEVGEKINKILMGDWNLASALTFKENEDGEMEGEISPSSTEQKEEDLTAKGSIRGKRLVATKLLEIVDQYNMRQIVKGDTFTAAASKKRSMLDLIFTDLETEETTSNMKTNRSAHDIIRASLAANPIILKPIVAPPIEYLDCKNMNIKELKEALAEINWDEEFKENTAGENVEKIISKLKGLMKEKGAIMRRKTQEEKTFIHQTLRDILIKKKKA